MDEYKKQATIFLQPTAAPSILGLYAFAGATLMVSAYLAKWYGGNDTALYLFPFAAAFGGMAQFAAGMWAYKVRDAIATAMHGMWGSFWIGYGFLNLLFATGTLTEPKGAFPALAFWFVSLAWITWTGTIAALGENLALTVTLGVLALASSVMAYAKFAGSEGWVIVAGWIFFASAILAWYAATAMMMEAVFGRAILPVVKMKPAADAPELNYGIGEPGVKKGQ